MNNMLAKRDLTGEQLAMVQGEYNDKKKEKMPMYLLWFFTGVIGGHRFYIGDTGYAIAMLCLSWATLGVWTLVDVFLIGGRLEKINEQKEREIIENVKMLSK